MDLRTFWAATDELRPFDLFKPPHLTALAILALICLGIVIWKEKLRKPKADRRTGTTSPISDFFSFLPVIR